MTIVTNHETETMHEGETLGMTLSSGTVVTLYGGLGTGKTVFVRGIASGLGIEARVSSPTFTIVNEYDGKTPLFHFDLYRIEDEKELFDIGWDDYLGRGGVCVVEWSENAPRAFPPDAVVVKLENLGGNKRRIEVISNRE